MEVKKYQEAYEKLRGGRNNEPEWLLRLREEAMAAFIQRGFPTLRAEAWRYTDVTAITSALFDADESLPSLTPGIIENLKKSSGGNFLLIVNGKFLKSHSRITDAITVTDIGEAILSRPELLEPHFNRIDASVEDAFYSLNTAFFRSGVSIQVPEKLILKEPIQVVFYTDAGKENAVYYSRNVIVLGAGSKAVLVEKYFSSGEKKYFTNSVAEVVLEKGAVLDHAKIQDEGTEAFHVASTHILQRHGSSFSSFLLSTGGKLARNESRVTLHEEGAACSLNGLYLGDGAQVLDQQTYVEHSKPDGKSHQLFKGLLAGTSRGVFRGRVMVRQDAQRTDAHQTNKALLLSDTAKVDAEPQLEILADDVKCSHGAAIGQLQEDALFYLRSRGIGEKEAGKILAQGFAREVIERPELEFLKDVLLKFVNKKLEKQFT